MKQKPKEKLTEKLEFNVTPAQGARFRKAAEAAGMDLSKWLRGLGSKDADRLLGRESK